MDRPERMPVGSVQATVKVIPSSQDRRPTPNSTTSSSNTAVPPPIPPIPSHSNAPSSSSLSASSLMTSTQVIALVREAMRNALESESQTAEASAASNLQSGVTVDLSRKGIQQLPDEAVNIMKNELERLALSHNHLSTLPARFSQCTSLRYLNIRGNQIKEFPLPLCDLTALEILDLGRNQLRVLPSDIAKLTSLKVLSVPKNQIRELPLCLADMVSLQVLKTEGNPISFPPKHAMQLQAAASPPNKSMSKDSEVTELAVTAHIKKFLKQHAINGRMDSENTSDETSESADPPRFPLKRVASGRFPIRVNGSDVSEMRSPNLSSRPPPIPSRSHFRGLSQQNTAIRRPGVMPLTIGNVNERHRSNSESVLRSDRPQGRNRRMGIVSKKASELGTLDEAEPDSNRFSHYRGLSYGSAMQGADVGVKSPASQGDSFQRPIYVRRLSVLPERRRESKSNDIIIEAAKGILYSVFQIHPMIQMLMILASDESAKRSSLEIVFYNTNSHVEELEQEIQKHDPANLAEEDHSTQSNENVFRACQTLVSAYGHVCTLLVENIDTFVNNGDARYIRTLLMLLYNSIMELRVTLSTMTVVHDRPQFSKPDYEGDSNTIKPYFRDTVTPATMERPPRSRSRQGTIEYHPNQLRVATDVPMPYTNGTKRPSNTNITALPQPVEPLALNNREMSHEISEEDMQFDRIFLSLRKSSDMVLRTLPQFNAQLTGGFKSAIQQGAPVRLIQQWRHLIALCVSAIEQTEILRNKLYQVSLKEPGARSQDAFWSLCVAFVQAWTALVSEIRPSLSNIPLPPDIRARLKPIQQSMKETTNAITQSPWHHHLRTSSMNKQPKAYFEPQALPAPSPITPQSAALGPAMQATVSTTPQTASFATAFHGNVFDRADALMANPGISMSRSGASSRSHSTFNSLSSISSISSDGATTPSTFSPNGNTGTMPPRMNGGKYKP